MSNKDNHVGEAAPGRQVASDEKRRKLVKGAAFGVGGITLTHWSRPVVETVVLPAHAQTTGPSASPPQSQVTEAGSGSETLFFDA